MARYISDQNKVLGLHESGTYAGTLTGSSFWIGQVQEHSVTDEEGLIETRYLGTATRNFDSFVQGPRDVTGTLTYNPSDMRLLFWAIGSGTNTSGPNSTFRVAEINSDVRQSPYASGTLNPPISFTLEDSKQSPGTGRNFVRTINGVVPNVTTLELNQGEKVTVTVDYIGRTLTSSSGTTTSVTEITRRPYLWSDGLLTIAGSPIQTTKSISFEINQNREGPHYIVGSRDISVPINQNRDYTFELTMDWEGTQADMLYNSFYKTNTPFNAILDLNADSTAGSQHATITFSGCYIVNTGVPSPLEGVNEATLTIRPETVTATEYNAFVASGIYGPY